MGIRGRVDDDRVFTSIAGLPAHPLLVHLSVVAAPLGALLLLPWALVPRWRQCLRATTVGVNAVAFLASVIAKSTGEALLPAMGLSEHTPGQVGPHAQYADLLVVAVGLAVFAVVMTALTGHAGAQLVWGNFPE